MSTNLTMPTLGESVVEGTITKWLVREGDVVTREQIVVSVATDKADTEVPAPVAGRIGKILVAEGATVKVGAPLCEIEEGVSAPAPSKAPTPAPAPTAAPAPAPASDAPGAIASPSVRRAALEQGVDLASVKGSGEHGRITRDDVSNAGKPAPVAAPKEALAPAPSYAVGGGAKQIEALLNGAEFPVPNVGYRAYKVPPYRPAEGDKVVPFSRRRRLTADHMVYSKVTAPHVVTVAEIDLHKTMKLREANKDRYKKEGVSLTVLAFVCSATVKALREFPSMNARLLDDAFVQLRHVNLGVAVDAPEGLVVPTIKKAEDLSVRGLALAIDEVAKRARENKITADDLAGGSFSVSNPGLKGNLFGAAVIAQPNVGILRMGEIQKRVVVVDNGGEDTMVIHPVMYAALSYDHRVVDGVLANSFLWRVVEILEKGEFEV